MKNYQKLTFSKIVSDDHEVPNNVSRSFLETQMYYFKRPNTLVYTSGDDIYHLVHHEKSVKIAIFTPFSPALPLFSLK